MWYSRRDFQHEHKLTLSTTLHGHGTSHMWNLRWDFQHAHKSTFVNYSSWRSHFTQIKSANTEKRHVYVHMNQLYCLIFTKDNHESGVLEILTVYTPLTLSWSKKMWTFGELVCVLACMMSQCESLRNVRELNGVLAFREASMRSGSEMPENLTVHFTRRSTMIRVGEAMDLDDVLTFRMSTRWRTEIPEKLYIYLVDDHDGKSGMSGNLMVLTLRTSMRRGSGMSGNLMVQVGLVMACSLAMLFLMCWNGVLP